MAELLTLALGIGLWAVVVRLMKAEDARKKTQKNPVF
jgi:hypothetical protein